MRCAIAGLVVFVASTARAEATDPAELFPANTLAYAEVARPGEFVATVADLLRGGALADPLKAAHDRLDKLKEVQFQPSHNLAAALSLVAAPEFAAELKRFRGAAIALTSFTPDHQPRVVAAVLLGDSHAAGLLIRSYLTAGPNVRRIGEQDGVPIFQHHNFIGPPLDEDGKPISDKSDSKTPRLNDGVGVATYAYTPGLFVVGSDKVVVADVLRRFAGKGDAKTLARTEAFKTHQSEREKVGVFLYADPAALAQRLEAAARDGVPGGDLSALLKFVVNPKAVKVVTGALDIRSTGLSLALDTELQPGVPSPLGDVLAGGAVSAGNLVVAGRPMWAFTLALPPAERRASALLALADAVAKANGALGRLPSEIAAAADPKPAELFRSVKAVTVFATPKLELPKGATPVPMLAIHTETEADAAKWEQSLPSLAALLVGAAGPLPTSSATVGGVRVTTLSGKQLPGDAALHHARGESLLVIGQDRKLVAEAAAAKLAPATGPAIGVGTVSVFPLVKPLLPAPPAKKPDPRTDGPQMPEPWLVGLIRASEPLPPIGVSVARTKDVVRVEFTLADPKAPLTASVGKFLDWVAKRPPDPTAGQRPGLFYLDR